MQHIINILNKRSYLNNSTLLYVFLTIHLIYAVCSDTYFVLPLRYVLDINIISNVLFLT
jgi:hypothetical protein